MAPVLTAQSPSQAHAHAQYILTQTQYHALVHCFETIMKFGPSKIVVKDSVLFTFVAGRKAVIQADYMPLIEQPVTMAFAPDKAAIKKMAAIYVGDTISISLNNGWYHIQGAHASTYLQAQPLHQPEEFSLPIIKWIGTELTNYDSMELKAFIGKKSNAIQLAIYDGQLEQIGIDGQVIYTFTAGMATQVVRHCPPLVRPSSVAFRYFGKEQSICLGQTRGRYILKVTNTMDLGVNLDIFEDLDAVSTASAVTI